MKRQKREHTTGIYKITNMKNGKIYIGQGKNVYARMRKHLNGNGSRIIRDSLISKYKKEDFKCEVLVFCEERFLDYYEIMFIQHYDCVEPKGMNIEYGGCDNKMMSEEAKDMLRAVMSGRRHSKETVDLCVMKSLLNKNSTATKVKDLNGRVWASMGDCSFELDMKHVNIMLSGSRTPSERFIELGLMYASEEDVVTQFPYKNLSLEEIQQKRNKKSLEKCCKPIISNTGEIWIGVGQCHRHFFGGVNTGTSLSKFLSGEPVSDTMKERYGGLGLRFMTEEEKDLYEPELLAIERNKSTKMVIDKNGKIYKSIKTCSEELDIPQLGLYFSEVFPWPEKYKEYGLRIMTKEEMKEAKKDLALKESTPRFKFVDMLTNKIYNTFKEVSIEFGLSYTLTRYYDSGKWPPHQYWVRDRIIRVEQKKIGSRKYELIYPNQLTKIEEPKPSPQKTSKINSLFT